MDTLEEQVRGEAGGDLVHTLRWAQTPTLSQNSHGWQRPGRRRAMLAGLQFPKHTGEGTGPAPGSSALRARVRVAG